MSFRNTLLLAVIFTSAIVCFCIASNKKELSPPPIPVPIEFTDALAYLEGGGTYLKTTSLNSDLDTRIVIPLVKRLNEISKSRLEFGVNKQFGNTPQSLYLRSPAQEVHNKCVEFCETFVQDYEGDIVWRVTNDKWLQIDVLTPEIVHQLHYETQ